MVLITILQLPLHVARAPVRLVSLLLVGVRARRRRRFDLPVAGLDEARAQSVLFALRRAARSPAEAAAAEDWLGALLVAQGASARLLAELDDVDGALDFWAGRARRGRHAAFALLRSGPAGFAREVRRLAHRVRRGRGAAAADAGAGAGAEGGGEMTSAELVEKRVLLLRLLRGALCEALAGVTAAAARLHLGASEAADAPGGGGAAADAGGAQQDELFARAAHAVDASMAEVAAALGALRVAAAEALAGQAAPGGATRGRDAGMLVAGLARVLGVGQLRHARSQGAALGQQEAAPAPAPPAAGGAAAPLAAARAAAAFSPAALPAGAPVHVALEAATAAAVLAARAAPLAPPPPWARAPSWAERNWAAAGALAVAAAYAAAFLVRHSRLAGSDDLRNWGAAAAAGARAAWGAHVVAPLDAVRAELFRTFRARPAIVTAAEYEADRASLGRMLADFQADRARRGRGAAAAAAAAAAAPPASAGAPAPDLAAGGDGVLPGMEAMMAAYERELKSPVRNLVAGDLARCLLIQVQKVKVDSAAAMLELDQILRSNELSISLVAAVPALALGGGALYGLGRWAAPAPPDPRRDAVPARMAMAAAERCLARAAAGDGGRELAGATAAALAGAWDAARALYAAHRGLLGAGRADAEWAGLRQDLVDLAAPAPPAARLAAAQRVVRTYSVFQQF